VLYHIPAMRNLVYSFPTASSTINPRVAPPAVTMQHHHQASGPKSTRAEACQQHTGIAVAAYG
jgi:hypothetical protein